MKNLILLGQLQQLEEAVTAYCQGKAQFLTEKKPFNFSSLINIYNSIELLQLDHEKMELMERFQQNVFLKIAGFHPKVGYTINFANEIANYKPLLQRLSVLENQAVELFNHYFDAEKPNFDWNGLHQIRAQINNLQDSSNKIQLMKLFEHGVLTTITQIEPKAYSILSFNSELETNETEELSPMLNYSTAFHR